MTADDDVPGDESNEPDIFSLIYDWVGLIIIATIFFGGIFLGLRTVGAL